MSHFDSWTVAEAKKYIIDHRDVGTRCPCCTRNVKVHPRHPNVGIAFVLILLYRRLQTGAPEFVHVVNYLGWYLQQHPEIVNAGKLGKGDWPKARFWGLIQEAEGQLPDGNPHAGMWRLTPYGIGWVEGKYPIPYTAYDYQSNVLGYDMTKGITIQQALKKKFDYNELMSSL